MSIQNLVKAIKELKELQRMSEEVQAEIIAIQENIKQEMTSRNTEELIAGEYKVSWKAVLSRRFDTTNFKIKYNDLYNQFTKETSYKRFLVA